MAADLKKNSPRLKKRTKKHEDKQEAMSVACEVIESMLAAKSQIFSVAQVASKVKQLDRTDKISAPIRQALSMRFGMRYRKVKPVAFQGNRERNLALRCLYAQKFMQVLEQGKRVINVDETWLNQMEFCRFKWCRKGETGSFPTKQVQPRISMIVGLASTGEVYCALTQVNTDSNVIMQFLGRLAQ